MDANAVRNFIVSVPRSTEWTRQHGEICFLKLGSSDTVVLGSVAAVKEIIEKNSSLADRPDEALMDAAVGGGSLTWAHSRERAVCYRRRTAS